MAFYKKAPEFDLGELNIENIFITDFMPSASGTYVKVYLLGLMFSKEENKDFRYDHRILANMLGMPLQDIHEAWQYWERVGIVTRHFHEKQQEYDVEFHSLRALYIQNNYSSKTPQKTVATHDKVLGNIQDEAYRRLMKSVESMVGHPLSYSESRELSDVFENYSNDADWVIRAYQHVFVERGIKNFKVVKQTMNQWLELGLTTVDQVNAHLEATSERFTVYREILKLLGIAYRMPNQGEKNVIDQWLDQYGFEPNALYALIPEISKKTLNVSFNYIDKALLSLKNDNIRDLQGFLAKSDAPKTEPKPSHKKKNYTIEKDKTYTEEELEALLLRRNK